MRRTRSRPSAHRGIIRCYQRPIQTGHTTANYGSDHYDEKALDVRSATLSADTRTLVLEIADLRPTWCMEIEYTLRSADGTSFQGTVHNTIHALAD